MRLLAWPGVKRALKIAFSETARARGEDAAAREALELLVGVKAVQQHFYLQNIVRRIVATVDNLPREKAAQRLMPVRPAAGAFLVAGEGEERTLRADNAARYRPYVAMAEAVDSAKLAAAYARLYALFQQAYRELGYPQGYFNDRLIEVIDHLLAAPELKEPAKLVQRKVLYEYADPELERRSAGQKILMRVGPENAGWRLITSHLNHERITLATPGFCESMLDEVWAWAAKTRAPAGGSMLDQQWVRIQLARVYAKLQALQVLNWRSAWWLSTGHPPASVSS